MKGLIGKYVAEVFTRDEGTFEYEFKLYEILSIRGEHTFFVRLVSQLLARVDHEDMFAEIYYSPIQKLSRENNPIRKHEIPFPPKGLGPGKRFYIYGDFPDVKKDYDAMVERFKGMYPDYTFAFSD